MAANRSPASDLDSPEDAIEISRKMWDHTPKRLPAEPIDDERDEECAFNLKPGHPTEPHIPQDAKANLPASC